MECRLQPGSSWLGFSGDDESVPVRELYGVFARARNDADRSAEPVAAVHWSGIPWGAEIVADEGRVLLAGLGGELDMIFAAPLGEERIVLAVLPNGGGGSGRPGPDGLVLVCTQTEAGALVFHGLAADSVESVDLVVAGVTHKAQMGENAFALWLADSHEADQERIELHRRDGTTNVIGLRPEEP